MKITALVENRTDCGADTVHGLSLYIETARHKLLFDLGPDDTLFRNAARLNIPLEAVDTVIISHGHNDHGGILGRFLEINTKATAYVQRKAFEPHYSRFLLWNVNVGLDAKLSENPRIKLLDGDTVIDDGLRVFTADRTDRCYSDANDSLRSVNGRDDFTHEQNLIITDTSTALIMGCGHSGVVNILDKAKQFRPDCCIGGYHLFNPLTKRTVSRELLDEIASEMGKYPGMRFYTCHCTGIEAFRYLSGKLPYLEYLSCGESITV